MRTLIAGICLLLLSATANAITWSPTDVNDGFGDIQSLRFSASGAGTFAIFDAGTLPSAGPAELTLARVDRVTFTLLGDNTWELENRAGETLNLGMNANFQFAHFDGATWTQENAFTELGSDTNIWFLNWGQGANLLAVDVVPIPVPAAVWLMGSALGLLVLRRRGQD